MAKLGGTRITIIEPRHPISRDYLQYGCSFLCEVGATYVYELEFAWSSFGTKQKILRVEMNADLKHLGIWVIDSMLGLGSPRIDDLLYGDDLVVVIRVHHPHCVIKK